MLDNLDVRETAGQDLDQARAKIEATREALQAVLDAHGGDELRQLVERLDRMAAEVARIEDVVASEAVGVGQ
jgi:hypothetical protein